MCRYIVSMHILRDTGTIKKNIKLKDYFESMPPDGWQQTREEIVAANVKTIRNTLVTKISKIISAAYLSTYCIP